MNGDAIRDGYDHAAYAVSYLAGALLPVLFVALCFAAGWWFQSWCAHRARVWRLRRDARRSGRTVTGRITRRDGARPYAGDA